MGGMASPEAAPGEVLVAVVSIKHLIPAIMSPVGKEKPRDRSHHQVEAVCSENESSLAKEKGADVLFKGKQTFGSHLVCLLSLK